MKKTLLVVLALTLISSVTANAKTYKTKIASKDVCIQKDLMISNTLKADTTGKTDSGIIEAFSYYKINAGDADLWLFTNRFARYVFKLEYQINNGKLVIPAGVPAAINVAEDNNNPGPNETFTSGGHQIKIISYTPTINTDGTADITIEWSYTGPSMGGSGPAPDMDSGTSIIKIDRTGSSWVDKASGHCYMSASDSGLQKIGKKL